MDQTDGADQMADQTGSVEGPRSLFEWRGDFSSPEVERLHSAGFARPEAPYDWWDQVQQNSFGWVCARVAGDLVGWVNVVWDGGTHAFILDTVVEARHRRRGIGAELVRVCVENARSAGCEWIHVDFDEPLRDFYLDSCGFAPAPAGVINLMP